MYAARVDKVFKGRLMQFHNGLFLLKLVGRVEARNPTRIDWNYHVGFRASTRPTYLIWTIQ